MEIGNPSLFTPAGITIAGRPVMALMGLSRGPLVARSKRRRSERLERMHERIEVVSVHEFHDELANREPVLQPREICCVEVRRFDAERAPAAPTRSVSRWHLGRAAAACWVKCCGWV